jgi:predicted permease
MDILSTIIPIFAVILLGWSARMKGLIPPEFFGPANRLVFYVAIPAMVFSAIAKSDFKTRFSPTVLGVSLASIAIICGIAWLAATITRVKPGYRGTFVHNSFHGNQGYIGLAVAFYYLGAEGLARASILMGFMMITNNLLAVIVLQIHAAGGGVRENFWQTARKIVGNPLILSALAGIAFTLAGLRLPSIVDRSLSILAGMALPLALLIIGGSLSFDLLKPRLLPVMCACGFKLILMPAIGLAIFLLLGTGAPDYLPAVILLAAPTATVAYVLARQMQGDADFAGLAISASTLMSALTYAAWLGVMPRM